MKKDICHGKVYDIEIDSSNTRYINLYEMTLDKVDKIDIYRFNLIEKIFLEDLEEGIKNIRNSGYRSIIELGFSNENFECNSVGTCLVFTLFGNRIKVLEKIYFPEIIHGMSCIIGAINFIDVITGKEYIIRDKNFGIESSQLLELIECKGYKHIMKTSFKNKHAQVESSFIRKLEPKRK